MFSLDAVVLGALLIAFSTVVIVAIVAFVIGALLAFLIVTPARSYSNHIARDSRHRIEQLDDQVNKLQERNEQLQEQNTSILAERNHLRGQLDALRQHNIAAASADTADHSPTPASAANPDGYGREPANDRARQQAEQQAPPQQAESLGERIRGFFGGNNNPDNTNTPTPNATG